MGTTAAVSVDIAASPQHRLNTVAKDVQTAVFRALEDMDLTCTSVTVSVLTIAD